MGLIEGCLRSSRHVFAQSSSSGVGVTEPMGETACCVFSLPCLVFFCGGSVRLSHILEGSFVLGFQSDAESSLSDSPTSLWAAMGVDE